MWLVLKEHWLNPRFMLLSKKLTYCLESCGHCTRYVHNYSSNTQEGFICSHRLYDWWNAAVLVCKSIDANISLKISHLCEFVYLCVSILFQRVRCWVSLFLCPLAVLWWAVGTQMWESRIWCLTRCWGERSRAKRDMATGRSTLHILLAQSFILNLMPWQVYIF